MQEMPNLTIESSCSAFKGYVLTGEMRRWCYNDGDWNWAENGDAACVGK